MNKLKYVLLGVIISYSLFIIYSMVSTYIYSSKDITLEPDPVYKNLETILDEKIKTIKEEDLTKQSKICFGIIKNIEKYSKNSVVNKMDKKYITKMFDSNTKVAPSFYLEAFQNCELSETDKSLITPLMLISMAGNTGTEQKIIFNYEFKLENKELRKIMEADISNLTYDYTKRSELLTAINLIDTLKYEKEDIVNE